MATTRYQRRPRTPLEEAKQFWAGKKHRRYQVLENTDKTELHDLVSEYGIFTKSKTRKESLIKAIIDIELPDPETEADWLSLTRTHATREIESRLRGDMNAYVKEMLDELKELQDRLPGVIKDLEEDGLYADCWEGGGYYHRVPSLPQVVRNAEVIARAYRGAQSLDPYRRILSLLGETQPIEKGEGNA